MLLKWEQPDLAKAAEIGRSTVADFERGARKPHARNLTAIQAAFEAAGILFLPNEKTAGPGLRLRDPQGD